jgi:hypothetical protein
MHFGGLDLNLLMVLDALFVEECNSCRRADSSEPVGYKRRVVAPSRIQNRLVWSTGTVDAGRSLHARGLARAKPGRLRKELNDFERGVPVSRIWRAFALGGQV